MKKNLPLFIFLLVVLSCSKSLPIVEPEYMADVKVQEGFRTSEEIKKIAFDAVNIFSPATKSLVHNDLMVESILPYHHLTKSGNFSPSCYIVNFQENRGFVIVGAEEGTPEVVAYVEHGNYHGETTPIEDFNQYMVDVSSQLSNYRDRTSMARVLPGIVYTIIDSTRTSHTNKPLVEVNWGQEMPFNMFCYPYPCGCVATAIAQIMSVYSLPTSISLTFPNAFSSSVSLNWQEMKNPTHLSSPDTTCTYCIQIGALLREIGERVGMQYSESGSWASSVNAVSVYRSMGYSCSPYKLYDLPSIISSLNNERPIHIRGTSASVGGHAWVVDGSRETKLTVRYFDVDSATNESTLAAIEHTDDSYLHFNYGGSGFGNGFYLTKRHIYGTGNIFLGNQIDYTPVSIFTGPYSFNNAVRIITDIRPQ